MEQTSGENGVVVSSAPSGFTVQIIRTSSGTVQQPEPRLFQLYDDEPGVAQTLLNIAQPGTMAVDQGQMGDFVSVDEGEVDDETVVVKEELEAIEDSNYQLIDEYNDKEKEERHEVADDIRSQIAELCNQLCDLGEESFLLSVRLLDGKEQHVGSVKGDHFCLLRPEIVQDFQNFCLGIEEERRPEEDDEMQESLEDTSMQDDDTSAKLENEQHELMDVETMTDKNSVQKAVVMKPKVILLKKSADGQSTEIDHQYITPVKAEPHPAEPASNDKGTASNKENKETTTSILFLCDICKNVFTDIKQLRQHKFDVHGESDYKCDKCARVFSLKKTYERHMMDAHMEGEEKHLCDSCVLTFHTPEELEQHIHNCHNTDLPMKCDICEQTFPDILRLMEHRKLHFDYACFCDKCWQGFFDYLELETHNQSGCRYKEALYKCHICGKRFTKLATISKHIDTHPVHSPHVCRMCGRGFDTEKELKYHRSGAHIIRPFKCEFCDKTFKKKDSVIEHRRLHMRVTNMPMRREPILNANGNVGFVDVFEDDDDFMGKPEFECNTCGIALKTQNMLDQHIHQHETAAEQYKCDCCPKIFFSLNLLNIHCRRDHKMVLDQQGTSHVTDLDKIQVCEWEGCNKTFYDDSKLRQHMKYHGQRADKIARGVSMPERSSATCEICGKVLKYKSYMKAHMLSHYKDHPFQCELCGQAYPTAKRLEDHVRVHNGEKPFKCRICEKCFTSKSLRNQHMLIHLGHKTYICDVCGKGFMSRKHFKDHMRIHAGEEPHKCETCGKDFIYYRSLVRHMQVHVDPRERNKPYKCEYCNKEYTEVTGYKHHMRAVHTGETPFQCDICGESFHRNDKLKRHIKSRHSIVKGNKEIIVTARRPSHGGPIIVKAENENQEDLLQIVEGSAVDGDHNELHVDVIQNENDGQQQVFLIGLGNDGNEATYLQETQVIEGPDGTRYIIAGSGEELQVIESSNLQQLQDGQLVEGGIIQQVHQVEQVHNTGTNDVLVMNDGEEETLSTLANMASEAQIANQ